MLAGCTSERLVLPLDCAEDDDNNKAIFNVLLFCCSHLPVKWNQHQSNTAWRQEMAKFQEH